MYMMLFKTENLLAQSALYSNGRHRLIQRKNTYDTNPSTLEISYLSSLSRRRYGAARPVE